MTGLIIALILAILTQAGVILVLTLEHRKEVRDLHDRLAAKSLEDYRYWRDRYPVEVRDYAGRLAQSRRTNEEILEKLGSTPTPSPADKAREEAAKSL